MRYDNWAAGWRGPSDWRREPQISAHGYAHRQEGGQKTLLISGAVRLDDDVEFYFLPSFMQGECCCCYSRVLSHWLSMMFLGLNPFEWSSPPYISGIELLAMTLYQLITFPCIRGVVERGRGRRRRDNASRKWLHY